MKRTYRLTVAGLVVVVGIAAVSIPLACSSISITEAQVFLPKRSVTPEGFQHPLVDLSVHRIEAADGVVLDGWYLTQDDARATVLFFGGQGFYLVQSIEYIEALTDLGLNVFMWDYRGYGQSQGEPTVEALESDSLRIYDYVVRDLEVPEERIVLHGHSLGSFLATHTSTQREAAALVLENPVSSVREWSDQLLPSGINLFLRLEPDEILAEKTNVDGLRAFGGALVIFAGSEDFVTSPDMARALHEVAERASSKALHVVEGGGHNGLYEDAIYARAYKELLTSLGRSAASSPPAGSAWR